MANRQIYEGQKSPYNYEIMDSDSELSYAKGLDSNNEVAAWTKKHNIIIRYRNKNGGISRYLPDFLVRHKNTGLLELIEIKGGHLKHDPNVTAKAKAAEDWCKQRGMEYRLIPV